MTANSGSFYVPGVEVSGTRYGVFIRHYFDVIRKDKNPNSIHNRLLRAGFFSPSANAIFQVARAGTSLLVVICIYLAFDLYFVSVLRSLAILMSLFIGGFVFFMAGIALERRGVAKEKAYRRLFPDFMDMLTVCVDAGLSIEAAADRVARELWKPGRISGCTSRS